jgi:hypothetical protein
MASVALRDNYGTVATNVILPRDVSWPVRVGLVPRLADCFQDRAFEGTSDSAAVGATVPVGSTTLLSGMGGVGKTQVAVSLAERLWRDGQLDLLVWISATSRAGILSGYARAGLAVAAPGVQGTDAESDAAQFHGWLSATDRRWLLVLDTLERSADLQGLWPPSRDLGRTVLTTRLRGVALDGPDQRLVQMGTFTAAEGAAYLQARLEGRPDLADDIDGVVTDLGSLPLALGQASAFLLDEYVPCSRYRTRWADRRVRLDDLMPDPEDPNGLPDDYQRTVAVTLSLSVDAADRARPAGLARPMLELASVLHTAGMPASLFTTEAAHNWLTHQCPDTQVNDPGVIRSALRCLHRLNLMTVDGSNVTVHALVQRVMRETKTGEELTDLAWAAADALVEEWPEVASDREHAQRLRDNAAAVYMYGREVLLYPNLHPVLAHAASSLGESGDAVGAVAAYKRLHADIVRMPDHNPGSALTVRHLMARWQVKAGNPSEAVTTNAALLPALVEVKGAEHPLTLATRNNLAQAQGEAGKPGAAVSAYRQLLPDLHRVLGPSDPLTLGARLNCAHWRGVAGDPAGAAADYEQMLDDFEHALGPDALETMVARSNLALLKGLVDVTGAITDAQDVLENQLRELGPEHPSTLKTRSNLATMRAKAGDLAGSIEAHRQLLADRTRVLGPEHPDTLLTRANIADLQGTAGDPSGAAAAYEHILADQLRILGPRHPDITISRQSFSHWREQARSGGAPTAAQRRDSAVGIGESRDGESRTDDPDVGLPPSGTANAETAVQVGGTGSGAVEGDSPVPIGTRVNGPEYGPKP